jgi:hypothetical protein
MFGIREKTIPDSWGKKAPDIGSATLGTMYRYRTGVHVSQNKIISDDQARATAVL